MIRAIHIYNIRKFLAHAKNIVKMIFSSMMISQRKVMQKPCLWNGVKRPCYLFARKFYPEALDNLMHLFSNFTAF